MSNYGSARIGHKKTKGGNVKAYNKFMRNLDDLVDENIQELLDEEVDYVQDRVEEIANKELLYYFSTVASCMELTNKPHLKDRGSLTFYTYNVFDRVVWVPLSERTRQIKRKLAGAGRENVKWYSYNKKTRGDMALKEYLSGKPFYESCEVTVTPFNYNGRENRGPGRPRKLKSYQLSLSVPLEEDVIIEQMGGEGDDQVEKAFGAGKGGINEERRPIFNPVAEYFTRQRIPRVIRETLKKEGRYVEFG